MRRLVAVLALGVALGLGVGAPVASAQMGYASPWAFPVAPYGYGGYGGPPGYAGFPYGAFPAYAAPVLSGVYNSTGFPTFGLFPYLALYGNVANPSPYFAYIPFAPFFGCTSTYTGSNYYVCR
ncbi:MAG TPA: hypothetical protein VFB73_07825 [Chloroflexota bacterium]|jgi:hypothetical protein|nr:hypothetical protein [Chloroflexota bacterium]